MIIGGVRAVATAAGKEWRAAWNSQAGIALAAQLRAKAGPVSEKWTNAGPVAGPVPKADEDYFR
ncbi:MAG TPA: hypothetical protein VFT05_06335 [Burkholderiaceae bacterium]|nr:hypothetical protein [Burkholderiaceae bacterium]